jgi:hypothetical protein
MIMKETAHYLSKITNYSKDQKVFITIDYQTKDDEETTKIDPKGGKLDRHDLTDKIDELRVNNDSYMKMTKSQDTETEYIWSYGKQGDAIYVVAKEVGGGN